MKELKVYCRREQVDDLVHALLAAGVSHMTINHIRSIGKGIDPKRAGVSWETGTLTYENAKVEFVCSEAEVDGLVRIIKARARTGEPGDGIVFVSPVDRAVKIRTGVEGRDALR